MARTSSPAIPAPADKAIWGRVLEDQDAEYGALWFFPVYGGEVEPLVRLDWCSIHEILSPAWGDMGLGDGLKWGDRGVVVHDEAGNELILATHEEFFNCRIRGRTMRTARRLTRIEAPVPSFGIIPEVGYAGWLPENACLWSDEWSDDRRTAAAEVFGGQIEADDDE